MTFHEKLRALIETHPLWPTVTDQELLDWGNAPGTVLRDRERVDAVALYSAIDPGKFADTAGVQWWAEHINVNEGIKVTDVDADGLRTPSGLRAAFSNALKAANQAEFLALIEEQVSRFADKDLFGVRIGDIEFARTL